MKDRSATRVVTVNLIYGMANNVVVRLGNLLLGVALARLLLPDDFGVYAIALTVQVVLANLADLGMTAYLVQSPDVDERSPTVLTLGTAIGVSLSALMASLASPIASGLGSPDAAGVIRVLSLTLVLSGVASVPMAIIQRRFQQGRQLIADLTSFVLGAVLTIILIEAGLGALSLAWSRVIGQFVAVALLFALSRNRVRFGFNRKLAREAAVFGVPLVGANVLSWVLLNMDYVVISRTLGVASLGVYVLAFNMSSWPTSAISQALTGVALPAFSRAADPDPDVQTGYLRAGMALTLAASVPFAIVLLSVGAAVIEVVYGTKWAAAAGPVAVLATAGALRPSFVLFAVYLTSRGATKAVLLVQLAWTAALLPTLIIGSQLDGIRGIGTAHLLVSVGVVLPAYLIMLQRRGIRIRRLRCFSPVIAGVMAWCASRIATNLMTTPSPMSELLVGTTVALGVYGLMICRWLAHTVAEFRSRFGLNSDAPLAAPDISVVGNSAVPGDQPLSKSRRTTTEPTLPRARRHRR